MYLIRYIWFIGCSLGFGFSSACHFVGLGKELLGQEKVT